MKLFSYLPFSHPYYSTLSNKDNYNKPIDLLERLSFSSDPVIRNYYVYTDSNCTEELRLSLESLYEFRSLINKS